MLLKRLKVSDLELISKKIKSLDMRKIYTWAKVVNRLTRYKSGRLYDAKQLAEFTTNELLKQQLA